MKSKMKITPNSGRTGGFTLVELMFGVVVVSIAVLALYQMFVTGTLMITQEYHRRAALEKAQAKMEMARFFKTQLDTVPRNLSGTFAEELIPPGEGDKDGIEAEYTILVTPSAELSRNGLPIYSSVVLTYKWVEKWGDKPKEQKIVLQTYF
jgi:prepilin-type N-terminal cleavage/methylation domain-containing protein